jgi:hypothetical protein
MKTKHGIGLGLIGLLVSTGALAAAPVGAQVMEEIVVTAPYPAHLLMEEIIVTAKHPDAAPKLDELTTHAPADILREDVISAPAWIAIKPEITFSL